LQGLYQFQFFSFVRGQFACGRRLVLGYGGDDIRRQVLDFYPAKSDKPTPVVFYIHGGGWQAIVVVIQSFTVWAWLIYFRVRVARGMHISAWYALTTPLGAGVFAAMMLTSAWKVLSGQGVTWRGRKYHTK